MNKLLLATAVLFLALSVGCGAFPGMATGVQVYGSSNGWYGPAYADPFWGPPAFPPYYGYGYPPAFGPRFYSSPFYYSPRYFRPYPSYRYGNGWHGRRWSHRR
ncbi:MAG: hypothetical protein ACREJU_19475 [Nitrospiraceae bacterium]